MYFVHSCLHGILRYEQPANIIELDDILEQATKDNQLVVIDFYNDNCPPCEKVAPLFQELSEREEFQNRVVFVKIKVDDHAVIVNQYSVTGWPTFLFLKNGQVQTEIVGGKLAEATLYDWIKLMVPKEQEGASEQQTAGVEQTEAEGIEAEKESTEAVAEAPAENTEDKAAA